MLLLVEHLADQVVALVVGVVREELHRRAEDVRGRLVETAGLTVVGEVRGVLGDAVRHLVARDVERGERPVVGAVTVAVRHLRAVPEGVHVVLAVVDAVERALAVAEDAVAAVDLVVVVPGLVGAVLRVDGRGLPAAGAAVAERRVRAGEQRAGLAAAAEDLADVAVLGVVHVGRVRVAAGRVLELVRRPGLRQLQRHRAAVQRLTGASDRLDLLLGAEHAAGVGVDEGRKPARRAVGLGAAGDDLVGQPGLRTRGVDDQLRGGDLLAGDRLRHLARGKSLGAGGGLAERRVDGQLQVAAQRLVAALPGTCLGLVHDEVTADDLQPVERAGEPHMAGAVGVDEHALHREGLRSSPVNGRPMLLDSRERRASEVAVGGGLSLEPAGRGAVGGADRAESGAEAGGDDGQCRHTQSGCLSCCPASDPSHRRRALSRDLEPHVGTRRHRFPSRGSSTTNPGPGVRFVRLHNRAGFRLSRARGTARGRPSGRGAHRSGGPPAAHRA